MFPKKLLKKVMETQSVHANVDAPNLCEWECVKKMMSGCRNHNVRDWGEVRIADVQQKIA